MNTTKLMKTYQVRQVAEQAKAAGYEVTEAAESLVIKMDGVEVLRALTHSSGKHYLVRYAEELLSEAGR